MVLRPIFDTDPHLFQGPVTAWNAVEQQQTAPAKAWWLITQPDHAALSGEIARHFSREGFPKPDSQTVKAIAMHDAGWELFESDSRRLPDLHPDGRPISFFEVAPPTFLQAWTASIDRAGEESLLGGYMVSQHFTWLGEYRLRRDEDAVHVRQEISAFIDREQSRQFGLKKAAGRPSHWDGMLPLLQFCDLFSLYLCCGTHVAVEFPQEFAAGRVQARFENSVCVLSPTPFSGELRLTVPARRYPGVFHGAEWVRIPVSVG